MTTVGVEVLLDLTFPDQHVVKNVSSRHAKPIHAFCHNKYVLYNNKWLGAIEDVIQSKKKNIFNGADHASLLVFSGCASLVLRWCTVLGS